MSANSQKGGIQGVLGWFLLTSAELLMKSTFTQSAEADDPKHLVQEPESAG
jgi:hypothetical protein